MKNKRKAIYAIAQRGARGKSTISAAIGGWYSARGVNWQGFDFDGDQRTFSSLYPSKVELLPVTGPADRPNVIKAMRASLRNEATIVDPRAHNDALIVDAMVSTNYLEAAKAQELGVTVLLFPSDDLAVMQNLAEVVTQLRDVNFVLVFNEYLHSRYTMLTGSPLQKALQAKGAASLKLPILMDEAKIELNRCEMALKQRVTFERAITDPGIGMDLLWRSVLEQWLRQCYGALDAIAAQLVPSPLAEEIAKRLADKKPDDPAGIGNIDALLNFNVI